MKLGKWHWLPIAIIIVAIIGMIWTDAIALEPINKQSEKIEERYDKHKDSCSDFDCDTCDSYEENLAQIDSQIAPLRKETIFNSALIIAVAAILNSAIQIAAKKEES